MRFYLIYINDWWVLSVRGQHHYFHEINEWRYYTLHWRKKRRSPYSPSHIPFQLFQRLVEDPWISGIVIKIRGGGRLSWGEEEDDEKHIGAMTLYHKLGKIIVYIHREENATYLWFQCSLVANNLQFRAGKRNCWGIHRFTYSQVHILLSRSCPQFLHVIS